jgi:hypothetical protein
MQSAVNRFVLASDSPAIRLGAGPNQLRSFGLRGAVLHLSDRPANRGPNPLAAVR